MTRFIALSLLALSVAGLAGCGYKGPLKLPDEVQEQGEREKKKDGAA